MVKPILDGAASSFEVTRTATDKYNAVIQRRLSSSVLTRCVSWYRAGGDGKISSVFPGAVSLYWLWMKTPVWSDYKVVGAERWASERKWAQVKTVVQVVALIVACIWLYTMQSMWDVLRDQVRVLRLSTHGGSLLIDNYFSWTAVHRHGTVHSRRCNDGLSRKVNRRSLP